MVEEPITNYHQTRERKFTFLSLEIRRLDGLDIFSLCIYAVAIIGHFLIQRTDFLHRSSGLIFIPIAVWFLVITTPFGLRFKSVYFSLIWLILSGFFLFAGTSLSYFPVGCFILYQLVRVAFWNKYHKEFIPSNVVRGLKMYRFVSKNEGRGGYREDKYFMKWLFWLGAILLACCFFGILGTKLK